MYILLLVVIQISKFFDSVKVVAVIDRNAFKLFSLLSYLKWLEFIYNLSMFSGIFPLIAF